MASTIKWSATSSYTTAIDGVTASPTLKNLANAASVLGNAIDNRNATVGAIYADFDLLTRFQSAPTAGGTVDLYLIPSVDGTDYADGSSSIAPPKTLLAGVFPVRTVTTAQRVTLRSVILPPGFYKALIINNSGQAMTNTDSENVLSYVTYNELIV